ncbi:dihydrodipicolinate synthase family protein [Luteipulveratus mongoliensis]|uniref:Dihydrodipicolinate synthase family protein n=1 Tax=Luteipulveratus mongoliensis TaxID=571913 RepID=A0A0K1JG04_9MICO|nr:dihydrodipicolinate synthase family protein [Luteipulveratus mongoliensis]AKU15631.1 hypothetical protein VV02_06815 [Luteipulveratus mongoliensis]
MTSVRLPSADGGWSTYQLREPASWATVSGPPAGRRAYAAAHVVAEPRLDNRPGAPAGIDWDSTLAFRRHLWSWGLGVADAMDTAQRGMGLDWESTQELIRRSAAEARSVGGQISCGAGTDHLLPSANSLDAVIAGYTEQLAVVEDAGATPILMASRHLAAAADGPQDYLAVYDKLLGQVASPVILHWLGPMFDPALAGYWGHEDVAAATDVVLEIIAAHTDRIDGIKVSLLDAAHEQGLRSRLPDGVRLYTGDDFNYPELIKGDGTHHSDALLGIFAAIAPAAATALAALDQGDHAAYDEAFAATVPLARHLFSEPTYYYKTGIAFLAWLSGHQPGFLMVGGLQSGRSPMHLIDTFRLADAAGLLPDPDLAAERMGQFLAVNGLV